MQAALSAGADISALLRFRAVACGDFVLLPPGTPHAIGAGVVLLEAQRVLPERRAVTYRYWDWQRRYDQSGHPDAHGQPRPLHVEDALAVTHFQHATDADWLARHRASLGRPDLAAPARYDPLCGAEAAPVASQALRVARVSGSGSVSLPAWDALTALTVIEGQARVAGVLARAGQTLALPAALGAASIELSRAQALISAACAP
jgi:mannose-6-phosphate isomerase